MPTPVSSAEFPVLTGVRATPLDAAEAGDVAAGVMPVTGDDSPHACQVLALAACIPLARLAAFLAFDAAVRGGPADDPGLAADDAGCELPIPLGVLRECRNVLAHARRVLGAAPTCTPGES